jgi:hypothetical protein
MRNKRERPSGGNQSSTMSLLGLILCTMDTQDVSAHVDCANCREKQLLVWLPKGGKWTDVRKWKPKNCFLSFQKRAKNKVLETINWQMWHGSLTNSRADC